MEGENQTSQQTEVIGLTEPSETVNNLSSMFDNMEKAKSEGRPVEEAITETKKAKQEPENKEAKAEAPVVKQEDKPEDKKEDKEENDDPREVLRKAMEERAKKKAASKPAAEADKPADAKEGKAEDDVTEDDLKVLPQDKPKTAKRIQALLKRIDSVNQEVAKTKSEAQEKATKLAELEKKLSEVKTVDPATDEKVKKQLDELAMFRRRYALDSDPEVKSKYDGRVEQAEASIADTLKRRGASPELLDLIKQEGGWAAFAGSGTQIPIGDKTYSAAEIAERILANLPLPDRKAVESAMLDQVSTRREKERFFKEEQEKANAYFKQQEEEQKKAVQAQEQQLADAKKTIETFRSKVESEDWIKDRAVPANATPEQKEEIEEHNAYNKHLRAILNKALNAKDLNGLLDVVHDSVRYWDERRTSESLRRENERLKAEVEAKSQEINRFRTGARSVAKSGSIVATTTDPKNERPRAPASLEEALERIERGENLGASTTDEE